MYAMTVCRHISHFTTGLFPSLQFFIKAILDFTIFYRHSTLILRYTLDGISMKAIIILS